MKVTLTSAGQALLDANHGPVTVTSYKLGSAYGYIPQATDTDIHGTLLFTGVPTAPITVNANVVKYSVYLDYTLGPFAFGEVGLFVGSTLFALAASDTLIQKNQTTSSSQGNAIRIDEYLSIVSTNYQLWLYLATSNNEFQMAVLASVDQLPPPQSAVPNAYVISGATSSQSAFQAYTDKNSLWNFDAYQYANQVTLPITGFDTQSVTIAIGNYMPSFNPAYFGEIILEFNSGALYGICRYVESVVLSGSSATFNFHSTLLQTPQVGDSVVLFGRQALSTTIPNLPIASTSQLGAVIVGPTLTVTSTGLLNVASASYPVTSVNGLTGAVVLNASNLTGFAAVAYSGNYSDLNGAPGAYVLPTATQTRLGGVKMPSDGNISVAGDGTIDLGFPPVKSVNGNLPDGTGNVVIYTTVVGLIDPTQIANGTDFDSIQTAGLYFGLDVDASSFLNAPTTATGGVLDVEPFSSAASGGDVIQRYTTDISMYYRRYSQASNTWSTWIQLADLNSANSWTATNDFTGGSVTVTTQAPGDNSTKAASTAFVTSAVGGAVTSFNTRTGAVTLTSADVSGVGGALVGATNTFTGANDFTGGSITAPTRTAGDSTTNVATTAFVATSFAPLASPALSGIPTAPTAASHTNTTQLATTAFVESEFASPPAIGTGTQNSAAFTTVTASTAIGVASGGTGVASVADHGVLLAHGTSPFTIVSPNATSGLALISQGLTSDPIYGNPTGTLLNVQVFTSSGTYTKTPGTNSVIVEALGGGAGGGGVAATSAGQSAAACGGGNGTYAKVRITSGFNGSTVTIGAAGTGGAAGQNSGTNGGTTSFGTFVSCPGGSGGPGGGAISSSSINNGGGAAGAATITGATTIISVQGSSAPPALVITAGTASFGSQGSCGIYGTTAQSKVASGAGNGAAGYGAGGGGAHNEASQPAAAGGNGTAGLVIVYEYA